MLNAIETDTAPATVLYRATVALPDALEAMEHNLAAILRLAGVRFHSIRATVDTQSGTASIVHRKVHWANDALDIDVRFPALPHDARLTKAELDRWTGYFLHEICHALYTDEQAWKEACKLGLAPIVNGLEDVRIEAQFIKSAIACNARERLVELLTWVAQKDGNRADQFNPNEARSLPWTLAIIGRARNNGYPIDVSAIEAKLKPQARLAIDIALDRLLTAQTTFDVLEIAKSLCKPKPQDKPQGGQGGEQDGQDGQQGKGEPQDGQDGQQGKGEPQDGQDGQQGNPGKGEPQDGQDGQQGNSGKGEPNTVEGEHEGKAGKGASEGRSHGAPQPLQFDRDQMEAIDDNPTSDKVREESDKLRDDPRRVHVEATMLGVMKNAKAQAGKVTFSPGGARTEARDMLLSEARLAGRLRQQLARVLKAPDVDAWTRRLQRGRIDRHAFGRIASGDYASPYAKRHQSDGYETEVIVILDGSGSMGGGRKSMGAAALALVVCQAAEQVGVKVECVRFIRYEIKTLKAVSDRVSKVVNRFACAAISADGGTPLTTTLALCAERLARRAPHKRKMVFCVTDGVCDSGPDMVKAVAKHAREHLGVETVGLAIDSGAMSAFDYEAKVSSADSIAKAGLGVLVTALEGWRAA